MAVEHSASSHPSAGSGSGRARVTEILLDQLMADTIVIAIERREGQMNESQTSYHLSRDGEVPGSRFRRPIG